MNNPTTEFIPAKSTSEPIYLLDDLIKMKEKFSPELFPRRIKEICDHLHELRGTPKEMLYFCATGIVAGIAGDRYKAENCCKDFVQYPNQYFLGIGDTSAGKSTALTPLIEAVKKRESKIYSEYKKALERNTDATDPRFIVSNATAEALTYRMSKTEQPLFSLTAEARDVFSIIGGRYRKDNGNELSFYCKAWSAEPYSADRIQRESFYIPRAFLSALWLAQPDVFAKLQDEDESAKSGFIPRLFLFEANAPLEYETKETPTRNDSIFYNWENFLLSLLDNRNNNAIATIRATQQARDAFLEYHNRYIDIQKRIGTYGSYVAKSREKACRLALVFAICGGKNEINEQTARNACDLVDYSNGVLLEFVSSGYYAKSQRNLSRIESLFKESGTMRLPARDFRNKKGIRLDELEQAAREYPNLLRMENGERNGKWLRYTPPYVDNVDM